MYIWHNKIRATKNCPFTAVLHSLKLCLCIPEALEVRDHLAVLGHPLIIIIN